MPSFPKPRPRAEEKAEARRAAKLARVEFRLRILERDGYRCRDCGRPVLARSDKWWEVGHAHEWPPVSLGTSRTDSTRTWITCPACHVAHQERRRRFEALDAALGADGPCKAVEATD